MLMGIVVTLVFWTRLAKRDDKLLFIYICALTGAFIGAKIVYVLAEGWLHFGAPDMWLQLATGKSIVGALLGGYAAVEIAKRATGHRRATGDWFAIVVPAGVIIGRFGCLAHGCCVGKVCEPAWYTIRDAAGVARWPSVPMEIAFNIAAAIVFFVMRRKHILAGQHFHLYLIGYGLFRFAHEFLRETPDVFRGFSGYQVASLAVAALGFIGFELRRRESVSGSPARAVADLE